MAAPTLATVRRVALHEAGHCAVACRLGLGINFVEVQWGADSLGCVDFLPDVYAKFRAGLLLGSRIMTSMAGQLAEQIARRGTNFNPATFLDYTDGTTDMRHVLEAAEMTPLPDGVTLDDFLGRLASTSYGHLLTRWKGVEALADHLVCNGLRANGSTVTNFFKG